MDTGASGSLSEELLKAAQMLKKQGLGHAAEALLAQSESEKKVEQTEKKVQKKRTMKTAAPVAEKTEKKPRKVKAAKALKAKAAIKAKPAKKADGKANGKDSRKATTGQSGPKIKDLGVEDLNKKERMVIGCFELSGEREVRTIVQLAKEAFQSQSSKKANSWTRNSLRRLVRGGALEKVQPGEYRLTQSWRAALKKH